MAVSVIENPPISFVLPNLNKTSPPIVPFKPKLVAVVWNQFYRVITIFLYRNIW